LSRDLQWYFPRSILYDKAFAVQRPNNRGIYASEGSEVRVPSHLGSDGAFRIGSAIAVKCSHNANKSCRRMDISKGIIRKDKTLQGFTFRVGRVIRRRQKVCVCGADRRLKVDTTAENGGNGTHF
jgi:hypothetical protein